MRILRTVVRACRVVTILCAIFLALPASGSASGPAPLVLSRKTQRVILLLKRRAAERLAYPVIAARTPAAGPMRGAAQPHRNVRSAAPSLLMSRRRGGGGSGQNRTDGGSPAENGGSRRLTAPAIVFGDIAKTYGDAGFALSPSSDSAGSFTFASGDPSVATVSGNTVTIAGAGTTALTATQAADGGYAGGAATATLTVAKAASSTALVSSNNPSQFSESVTLTATVTSGATGTVSFYTGAVLIGTATIARGSGSVTSTTLTRGTGSITAVYAGNANFNGSTSAALTQRVYRNRCLQAGLCRNGGSCANAGDGFQCTCVGAYSGSQCELNDSWCNVAHGSLTGCHNLGTCVPDTAGGHCTCLPGYSGDRCQDFGLEEARARFQCV